MIRFYRGLLWGAVGLSTVCLLLIVWSITQVAWHWRQEESWQQRLDHDLRVEQKAAPSSKDAAAAAPLTAEQKIELQQSIAGARALLLAEIHAADADERAILDRLVTLVGVFSAILGLCAFATVRLAREDALEQQKRIEKELEKLLSSTRLDLEEFRKQIWSELPEMRNLKDSLRDLMLELERTIPNEADWNEAVAYESLSAIKRESILIAESTVNALQIFVSRDSPANVATQTRLYRALARFYFGRFRAEKKQADAERADIYARKAGEMESNSSATDRLRGAIFLAQYRILKENILKEKKTPPVSQKDTERLESLLATAEGFLKEAIKKDGSDAGAALNLALAARYRENFDEAIRVSKEAIENRGKMSSQQVHKYLPSLYLNLACYFARKADREPDSNLQKEKRKEVVELLTEGMQYLKDQKNSEAASSLREMIMREKLRGDALKNLGEENMTALDGLASGAMA